MSANKYDDNFKTMIIDLYKNGESVSDLASEYGVRNSTIYKWLNKDLNTNKGDELSNLELKREIARLKSENDILKKAIAIFTN